MPTPTEYRDAGLLCWMFNQSAWRARRSVVLRLDMIRRGAM